jgi:hypothetical protein
LVETNEGDENLFGNKRLKGIYGRGNVLFVMQSFRGLLK